MKKILLILAVILFIASAFKLEKSFVLTEEEANILYQTLETSKKVLPLASNISALDASKALSGADSIQRVLRKQVTPNK